MLDNEEGTIINFPAEVDETTPLYEQENETVSETFLLTLSFYKLYISHWFSQIHVVPKIAQVVVSKPLIKIHFSLTAYHTADYPSVLLIMITNNEIFASGSVNIVE